MNLYLKKLLTTNKLTKKNPSALSKRSQIGAIFMVEMLVSVLIASIMGTVLVSSMCESVRVSSKAQSQIVATAIAQQVIDSCRNRNFSDLITPVAQGGCMGSGQELVVNGSVSGSYPALFPRSLVLDLNDTSVTWCSESRSNIFSGTVIGDVTALDNDNALVAVTVSWNEHGGHRRYSTSAQITRFGLRNN